MKFILVLFSIFILKTCDTMSETESHENILNGNYIIEIVDELDVSDFQLTVQFNQETKQVSGFSGCNRFFGSYTLNENILDIGPLASTKMMCQDPNNKIEAKLLDNLSNANSFSLKENILVLNADNHPIITAILK
jgi:heat shock protein HslJ